MNTQDFYINNYSYINTTSKEDISFIPLLLKRKLSALNRSAFYTLNQTYNDNVDLVVYASRYGEFDKLIKIINQYKTDNEVSPVLFSSSVHNSTVGAFLSFCHSSKPYMALAAVKDTLPNAILTSLANNKTCLLCYGDYINETPISISVLFSRKENSGKHCRLIQNNINDNKNINYIESFKDFLSGKTDNVQLYNFKLEEIKDE